MKSIRVIWQICLFLALSVEVPAQIGLYFANFTDKERKREIKADVFYPAETAGVNAKLRGGPYPVIVFGHAMAVPVQVYGHFITEWTNAGYILVLPKTEMSMSANFDEFAGDIAWLPEEMLRESRRKNSPVFGGVSGRFAATGHSMGASCSILAAGRNSRFETVVAMAPPELYPSPSETAAKLSIPVLVITGSDDGVTSMDKHVLPIYYALNSHCKQFIAIKGGSHCGFAGTNWLCDLGETILSPVKAISRAEQHTISNEYILPWLNYHLKDQCAELPGSFYIAMADSRIDFFNDCAAFISPCLQLEDDHVRVESGFTRSLSWMINGESLNTSGSITQPVLGSGVYQASMVLRNGCRINSEEFWLYDESGFAEKGELRSRFYQSGSAHDWYFEAFGARGKLNLQLWDAKGDKLLVEQEVSTPRLKLELPRNYKGIIFYRVLQDQESVLTGKLYVGD